MWTLIVGFLKEPYPRNITSKNKYKKEQEV